MDVAKSLKFIEKAIEKTKYSKMTWLRLRDADFDWHEWGASGEYSFVSRISDFAMVYLLQRSDNVEMAIIPGKDLATQFFPEDDDVQSAIIRLYNIVYNMFPNVDKALDEFINSD